MAEYMKFWLAKFLVEHGIEMVFIAALLLFVLARSAGKWFKQVRCKHDGSIHETGACDALCMKCGKNLGFIGAFRERAAMCREQSKGGE
ncbi:hypothetical protein [Cupriavidus sp. Marseille-Q8015]